MPTTEATSFSENPIQTIANMLIDNLGNSSNKVIEEMLTAVVSFSDHASTLLIIFVGLRLILGYGDLKEVLTTFFKIIFIVTILYSADLGFKEYIIPAIEGTKKFFSHVMGGQDDVYQTLDLTLSQGLKITQSAFATVGAFSPSTYPYILYGTVVFILSVLSTVYITFILLGTEIIIRLLFAFGPFYIVLLLFNTTRQYFFLWVNTVSANIILYAIAVFFCVLSIGIFTQIIEDNGITDLLQNNTKTIPCVEYDNTFGGGFGSPNLKGTECEVVVKKEPLAHAIYIGIIFYLGILLKLISEIPNLAQSLSGGTSAGASAVSLAAESIHAAKKGATRLATTGLSMATGGLAWAGRRIRNKISPPLPPPPPPVQQMLGEMKSINDNITKQTALLASMDPRLNTNSGGNNTSLDRDKPEKPPKSAQDGKEVSKEEKEIKNDTVEQNLQPSPEPAATPPAEEKGQGATEAEAGKAVGNDSNKINSPEKVDVNVNTHVDADVIAKGGRNSGGDGGSPNNGLPSNAAHGASGIGGAIDSAQRESAQQQSQTGSNTQPSTPATSGGSGSKGTPSASNSTTPPAPQNEKKPSITDPKGNKPPKEPPIKKL